MRMTLVALCFVFLVGSSSSAWAPQPSLEDYESFRRMQRDRGLILTEAVGETFPEQQIADNAMACFGSNGTDQIALSAALLDWSLPSFIRIMALKSWSVSEEPRVVAQVMWNITQTHLFPFSPYWGNGLRPSQFPNEQSFVTSFMAQLQNIATFPAELALIDYALTLLDPPPSDIVVYQGIQVAPFWCQQIGIYSEYDHHACLLRNFRPGFTFTTTTYWSTSTHLEYAQRFNFQGLLTIRPKASTRSRNITRFTWASVFQAGLAEEILFPAGSTFSVESCDNATEVGSIYCTLVEE